MDDYIERGPLLEAFKAKCCEDCPDGLGWIRRKRK